MRLTLIFILFPTVIFAGMQHASISKVSSYYLQYMKVPAPSESYDVVIDRINKDRKSLKKNEASLDSCKTYFLDQFENNVFPHWVGTSWDYNGYTNTPGAGKLIACGYFVSTPLKHMGFNWNRYELAKMYSKQIVETITPDIYHYEDKTEMIMELKGRPDHLYIVGLDSHVGMFLKRGKRLWFVHSNYYDIKGPDKEIASTSQALDDSGSWFVGTFTTDKNMEKWLNGTYIATPRD